MPKHSPQDLNILEMALIGFEVQKQKISAAIAEIRARLGQRGPGRPKLVPDGTAVQAAPGKRMINAAARKRMAMGQRRRWAGVRKAHAAEQRPKRKLTAAARRKIGESTRKRWAALRKAGKNPTRLAKLR